MEERISGIADMMEEIDSSAKENVKLNKFLKHSEVWDIMKRQNLRLMEIEEGEELQLKSTENIFNKITGKKKNFPKMKKHMTMKVLETYRTPNRLDQKNKVPSPYNNQNTKHTE